MDGVDGARATWRRSPARTVAHATALTAVTVNGTRAAWRWYRRPPAQPVRDAVRAVVWTTLIVYGSYGEAHPTNPGDQILNGHPVPVPPAAAYLLVVAAGLALAVARRWPVPVLAFSAAAVAGYSLLGYENGAALIIPYVALYMAATMVSAWRAIGLAAATLAVLMASTSAASPSGPFGGGYWLIPGLVTASCFAGIAVASRRAYVASVQAQIKARAEQDTQRRVSEERLRIARELHDVVAHTMATINVQAGVAAHVLTERPDAAAEALQAIRASSKEGLRELRAILNVLRMADEADPTQPVPGIAQLGALIDGTCRAGVATTLSVTGRQRPLTAAVDLAAYRITQESLTNVIKHAGPATAAVTLSYHDSELRIEVTDTGCGSHTAATGGDVSGHGLTGMRERAASVGGTVEAGPAREGGYRVAARIPLAGQELPGASAPARPWSPAESQPGDPARAANPAQERRGAWA